MDEERLDGELQGRVHVMDEQERAAREAASGPLMQGSKRDRDALLAGSSVTPDSEVLDILGDHGDDDEPDDPIPTEEDGA